MYSFGAMSLIYSNIMVTSLNNEFYLLEKSMGVVARPNTCFKKSGKTWENL